MMPNNETRREIKEAYFGLFCSVMIGAMALILIIKIIIPYILSYAGN
jgi:hypothetical protein